MRFKLWFNENEIFPQLKSLLPNWPDYVINDWLMKSFENPNGFKDIEDCKNYLTTDFPQQFGRQVNQVHWQLMPVNIKMDIFDQETMNNGQLAQRVQGLTHQGPSNKDDSKRTAYAAKNLTGTSYDEPIILAKMGSKYQLIEGWHRVIELLNRFPQGTEQKAWIMI